jgi:hypothetical protein
MSLLSLKILLEEVINEIGDFKNINSYEFKSLNNNEYIFNVGDDKVNVYFEKMDPNQIQAMNEFLDKDFFKENIYNVVYDIEGVQSQFTKSNYSILVKILKTVTDIIVDFIDNNDVSFLTFYSMDKTGQTMFKTDPQKTKLNKIIITQNMNKLPGWKYRDINLGGSFEGTALYKDN